MKMPAIVFLVTVAVFGGPAEDRQQRVHALETKLLAPCCYKEPVSVHQSDVSVKMRAEIARMVGEGKSDGEILATYSERYGARVVSTFAPMPGWAPWIPWGVALLGGAVLFWWLARVFRRPAVPR